MRAFKTNKILNFFFCLCFVGISSAAFSQISDKIPSLIPFSINQKVGYINQQGRPVIAPDYEIAMFFAQDCNLLNSPNEKLRVFGSSNYATVEKNRIAYRINKKGKRVYQYKKEDLGKCVYPYEHPKYNAYILDGQYGLISKKSIDSNKFDEFLIPPSYQALHILDGNSDDPMIIAVMKDKFGVVNKKNEVVIPFIYEDIKPNLSWKTACLFEVSVNGIDYFYVNRDNYAYNLRTIK